MAGIKDVARLAGVSVSTVSYVLSGKRAISQKTCDKVLRAIDDLGYEPDANARKMRGVSNRIIALSEPIRGDINHAKYNAYSLQATWAAQNAGYDVLLLTGEDAVSDIGRVTKSNLVDGVVLFDVQEGDERAKAADSFGKPCVAIGSVEPGGACACVDIDFGQMGRRAADYLYARGHRRVLFLRANQSDYERRSGYVLLLREGFVARAHELGIAVDESPHVDVRHFDAAALVREQVLGGSRPTAILGQADADVMNLVLGELQTFGLSVPGDVSVMSCGTFFEGELMRGAITEMPLEPARLCGLAMDWLIADIEESVDVRGKAHFLAPTVVDRGSVADLSEEAAR